MRKRITALVLALVCTLGLLPLGVTVSAANTAPESITLEKADYGTGTSASGLQQYTAPNGLGTVTLHNFRMNVGNRQITGFCGDHRKTMGNRFQGDTWSGKSTVPEEVKPLLAYYYWACENDASFNGGESGWQNLVTNSYIQCCLWLAKSGDLPKYEIDRQGWINAVAEQRDAAYAHYGLTPPTDWTSKTDAAYRLDKYLAGQYGTDWEFWEYAYAGSNGDPQPVVIGWRDLTVKYYSIKKIDTAGANVAGVSFHIESADGTFNVDVTTDASGKAEFTSTAGDGWYTVTETAAPAGYNRTTAPTYVQLTHDTTGEIRLVNTLTQREGNLTIRKVDADNPNIGLSGAVIKLTHVQSGDVYTLTTGTDGYCTIPKSFTDAMHVGVWIAEEVTPPENYRLSPDVSKTKQQFNWTGTVPISLIFENDSNVRIRFRKTDENGHGLTGAKIAVYKDGMPITAQEVDAGGYIIVNGVSEGYYTFEELVAPPGYAKGIDPYVSVHVDAATLQGEALIDVVMPNKPKPQLTIKKVDAATGAGVADAAFEVRGIGTGYRTEAITLSGGSVTLTDLDPGAYEVRELSVPAPYILDATPQTVALMGGERRTLVFANSTEPGLRIVKTAAADGAPIGGVGFRIEQVDGAYSSEFTTNANGEIVVAHLPAGTYKVREISVPDAYLLSDEEKLITLQPDRTATLEFQNQKKPQLTIKKTDSYTGDALEGAKFRVWHAASAGEHTDDLGIRYTDANGSIRLDKLEVGWYSIEEQEAPVGYQVSAPAVQNIYLAGDDDETLDFRDQPLAAIIVSKRDSVSGKAIAGATFRLRYLGGESGIGGTIVGEKKTTASGMAIWTQLRAGNYVVEEIAAADGYNLNTGIKNIYFSGKQQDVVVIEFENTMKGTLHIEKRDSATRKPLSGARFRVEKISGELVGIYETDTSGSIVLSELDAGWYQASEIKAPSGYQLDPTVYKVEVQDGKLASLVVENDAAASLLIHKIDSKTGKGLGGAKFVLYDHSMTPIGEYDSDSSGYVHLNKTLTDGKYFAREISAPSGYILDNSLRGFYVRAGDTTVIEWENEPRTAQVQVCKVSAAYHPATGVFAGTPLYGAIYTVYDKRMNVVDTIRTNESGVASSKQLPLGLYYVRETTAPHGYMLDPVTHEADLEFVGQVYRLNLVDSPLTVGVSITKSGPMQVVNGQNLMRYLISGVSNDSTCSLDSFYIRDTLPTDAFRLTRLTTGTYSQTQNYKVSFNTNVNASWRTAYDNLSTAKSYSLDLSAQTLGLASDEYVTQVMLSFGVVPPGFRQTENIVLYGSVLTALPNQYAFTNKADTGGLYGADWVQGTSRWTTTVQSSYKLPRTGY